MHIYTQRELLEQVAMNIAAALVFVILFGLLPLRWRRGLSVALLGYAAIAYVDGEFGIWEFGFAVPMIAFALLGLRSYWAIGAGWLVHTIVDLLHHSIGDPLVHSSPLSSLGCAIFDPLIAMWYFAGAPDPRALWGRLIAALRGDPRTAAKAPAEQRAAGLEGAALRPDSRRVVGVGCDTQQAAAAPPSQFFKVSC